MVIQTKKPDKNSLFQVYQNVYTALKKKDYELFCNAIDAPSGQKMPKKDWNKDSISMLLDIMPDPKSMKFLNLVSSGSNYGYQFLSAVEVEDGLYFYGMIFLNSTKNGIKFSRVLVKNITGKEGSGLEENAIEEMKTDPEFALDEQEAQKRSKVIKTANAKAAEKKAQEGLSLKNTYQDENGADFSTPTIKLQPPKNWFDMNASGNTNRAGLEAYTMGAIGYSENGQADYSTKIKLSFQFAKSEKTIDECAAGIKESGFSIQNKTKTDFVATRDDEFWGKQYQLIQKVKNGYLIFDIACKDKTDLEESKKALKLLVGKVTLEY